MKLRSFFFSPKGKIPRLQFFLGHVSTLFFFIAVAFSWALTLNFFLADTQSSEENPPEMVFFCSLLVICVLLIAYSCLCLYMKRFRDAGFSAWLSLLGFIPYLNLAMILFLLFFPSQRKKDQDKCALIDI
ncbi:MAG: hypothetical protein BGO43_03190 [Gammaproteobacteria bacterium 39-13]|jgi:uncharacterized membrane protein YhaH (DUF805 family)|nr:DUF805 domain-containing protein [Gammaproteobacteria bacterium]OJV87006.1 MAG: hypothetical protein BGO43_03190 [Gammaproteobacteria bacterium 39-13]